MMQNNASAMLKDRIQFLERKSELEYQILHTEIKLSIEKLKPLNIIKNTFAEVIHSPNLRQNTMNSVIGLVTGYFTEKVVVGPTYNPIKKIFGILLEAVVANAVAKNFETIKNTGASLFKRLFKKNHKNDSFQYN